VGNISQRLIFLGGVQYEEAENEMLKELDAHMVDNKLAFSEPAEASIRMRFRVGVENA
jgi:hypothetical protein